MTENANPNVTFRDREKFLTRREVIKRLDISYGTLRKLVKEGKLHPIKQGPSWVRYRADEIDAYIDALIRKSEEGTAGALPNWL